MQRWEGKVAVVTGASVGIGAAICQELTKHQIKVVGLARRTELVDKLAEQLATKDGTTLLSSRRCDVTSEEDIISAFDWIEANIGPIEILINNAGVLFPGYLIEGSTVNWRRTLDTNVMGVAICTREAVQRMRRRCLDGHVINVNSVVGHLVPKIEGVHLNMYTASKHAVTALTEATRRELNAEKSNIKISCINPGIVETDMLKKTPDSIVADFPAIQPVDVAKSVIHILDTPPLVLVYDLTIMSVGEIH